MALIKCYECGTEISDLAQNCPKCGAPTGVKSNIQSARADYAQQQEAINQQIKEQHKAARRTTVFSLIFSSVLSGLSYIIPSLFRRRLR